MRSTCIERDNQNAQQIVHSDAHSSRQWGRVRCRVLISALAEIFLHRYIKKICQGHGELSLKIEEQGGLHP